jgi:hypothetical protein
LSWHLSKSVPTFQSNISTFYLHYGVNSWCESKWMTSCGNDGSSTVHLNELAIKHNSSCHGTKYCGWYNAPIGEVLWQVLIPSPVLNVWLVMGIFVLIFNTLIQIHYLYFRYEWLGAHLRSDTRETWGGGVALWPSLASPCGLC